MSVKSENDMAASRGVAAARASIIEKLIKRTACCTDAHSQPLYPYRKDLRRLIRSKTTLGRRRRIILLDGGGGSGEGGRRRRRRRRIDVTNRIDLAYVVDRVLRRQRDRRHAIHANNREMAHELLLVDPRLISRLLATREQPVAPPTQQNLKIADQAGRVMQEMTSGLKPYDDSAYNQALNAQRDHLKEYQRKIASPASAGFLPDPDQSANIPTAHPPSGQPMPMPISSMPMSNAATRQRIIDVIPRGHRREGSSVLDWIDNSRGLISYNENNEVSIDGERIPNSNLTDMITWLVGSRKRNPPMPGLNAWMNALSRLGLPRSIIKEESRQRALEIGAVNSDLDPTLISRGKAEGVDDDDKRRRKWANESYDEKKMIDWDIDDGWKAMSRKEKKKLDKKNSKRKESDNKKKAKGAGSEGMKGRGVAASGSVRKRYKKKVLTPGDVTFKRWIGSLASM